MNDATFDAIVSGFFRAATGAIGWDAALLPVQQAFDARAAVLHTVQPSTGRLLALRHAGPDLTEAVFAYVREYHAIDPRRAHALRQGPASLGIWNHDHETFSPAFITRDRFYRHYLPAFDARRNSNVAFALDADVVCGFALELHARRGPLGADERDVVQRLGRYMEEALHAWERVRRLAAQALAGHRLLRSFGYPMWLMDADRFVSFENDAGRAERERGTCVAVESQRLLLIGDRADREFGARLHRLASGAHGAHALVDLRRTRAEAPLWLHLAKLVPDATLGAFGETPQVVATLFDPARVMGLDAHALGEVFALTPAEARVAARLADGSSVQAIAADQGTSIYTVRAHVRSLHAKFGVQRTADVMRILRQGEALWARAGA